MTQVIKADCCGRTGHELPGATRAFTGDIFKVIHNKREIQVQISTEILWPEEVKDHCQDCAQVITTKALEMAHEATRKKRARKPQPPPEQRQEVPVN